MCEIPLVASSRNVQCTVHISEAGRDGTIASMMSSSALLKGERVELVFGSGGSKRIRTAITQVLTQYVDFERDPATAVNAPRLHWDGEVIQIEPGFPEEAVASLAGHFPVNLWSERNVYFGGVHSVAPGEYGVGDPRRGGSIMVVQA